MHRKKELKLVIRVYPRSSAVPFFFSFLFASIRRPSGRKSSYWQNPASWQIDRHSNPQNRLLGVFLSAPQRLSVHRAARDFFPVPDQT